MEKAIIPEFTLIEDNNEQLTKIDIVGKTVSDIKVLGGNMKDSILRVDGNLLVCFDDGDSLGLSAYDETFFVSYNCMTDSEEFRKATENCSIKGAFAKKTLGRNVVSSTFCGKDYRNSPLSWLSDLSGIPSDPFIELDNGTVIRFSASSQDDILDVFLQHR